MMGLDGRIRDLDGFPVETREAVITRILASIASGRNASLNIDIDDFSDDDKMEADLIKAVRSVVTHVSSKANEQLGQDRSAQGDQKGVGAALLPRTIAFPYARHSSYPELRHLVDTFKPKDVWPCTVHDEDWFRRGITMRDLFGQNCSEDIFAHDAVMEQRRTQLASPMGCGHNPDTQVSDLSVDMPSQLHPDEPYTDREGEGDSSSSSPFRDEDLRAAAFETMQRNAEGYGWAPIELISTTGHHSVLDTDLGNRPRVKCGSR